MFKFFYAPNTCALASHIALEEAGAEYEAVSVDFKANAQRAPEYLAINPKGRVPSLVTSDGILTETSAMRVSWRHVQGTDLTHTLTPTQVRTQSPICTFSSGGTNVLQG